MFCPFRGAGGSNRKPVTKRPGGRVRVGVAGKGVGTDVIVGVSLGLSKISVGNGVSDRPRVGDGSVNTIITWVVGGEKVGVAKGV